MAGMDASRAVPTIFFEQPNLILEERASRAFRGMVEGRAGPHDSPGDAKHHPETREMRSSP
jgi:hypothetical protein